MEFSENSLLIELIPQCYFYLNNGQTILLEHDKPIFFKNETFKEKDSDNCHYLGQILTSISKNYDIKYLLSKNKQIFENEILIYETDNYKSYLTKIKCNSLMCNINKKREESKIFIVFETETGNCYADIINYCKKYSCTLKLIHTYNLQFYNIYSKDNNTNIIHEVYYSIFIINN
jgi:hypothetical protein